LSNKIQIRRGNQPDLPSLDAGEMAFTLDTERLYIGNPLGSGNILMSIGPQGFDLGNGADGYVTFYTGPNSIGGDNDFYWDRENNRLGLGTEAPTHRLTVDGYIVPELDLGGQLGTPTQRWEAVHVGPGSIHITSDASETGTGFNWRIGIDQTTGNEGSLIFVQGEQRFLSIDPITGNVIFDAGDELQISGALKLPELATPPLDEVGYGKVYVDSSDKALHFLDSTGADYNLLITGGTGTGNVDFTEGADGYVTFFIAPGVIAGDNDFFYDRETSTLELGGELQVYGNAFITQDLNIGGNILNENLTETFETIRTALDGYSSGTITGSGTSGQVTYFDGTSSITSSGTFNFSTSAGAGPFLEIINTGGSAGADASLEIENTINATNSVALLRLRGLATSGYGNLDIVGYSPSGGGSALGVHDDGGTVSRGGFVFIDSWTSDNNGGVVLSTREFNEIHIATDINNNPDDSIVMTFTEDHKVGVRTTTVPHASVGAAMMAFDGDNASVDGPHLQFTTVNDNFPLLQILNYTHDSIWIQFDKYYDGVAHRSADAGSNYEFLKSGDIFYLRYDSGIAAGSAVTMNHGWSLDTNGVFAVGAASPVTNVSIYADSHILTGGGFQLMPSSGTPRYGLKYGSAGGLSDADLIMLTNREVGGSVAIATDNGIGGGSGETERIRVAGGNTGTLVGIGTSDPHEALTINGILSLEEQDIFNRTHDGYGSLWVKSDGTVHFTNDAGTDYDLTVTGGSGNVSQTSGFTGADGYIAFFTGDGEIAGDNDLYYNRENGSLTLTQGQFIASRAADIPSGSVTVARFSGGDTASAHQTFSAAGAGGYTANYELNDTGLHIGHNSSIRDIQFQTNSINRLQIEGTGKVIVVNDLQVNSQIMVGSTSNPVNTLDVEGNIAIGASYSGSSSAPTNGMIVQGRVGLSTSANSTSSLIVDDNGNATTSVMDVTADDGSPWLTRQLRQDVSGAILVTFFDASGNFLIRNQHSTGDLQFSTADASPAHMVLTDAGSLGIGTVSPSETLDIHKGGNYQLRLTSPDEGGGFWNIAQTDQAWAAGAQRLILVPDATSSLNSVLTILNTNGHIGLMTNDPHERLTINGVISLQEQDEYNRTHDGYGSLWAKSDGKLYFTNDAGTDYDLTASGGSGNVSQTSGFTGADGYIAFFTGDGEIAGDNDLFFNRATNDLYLMSGGKLGIGTTSPSDSLDISEDGSTQLRLHRNSQVNGAGGGMRFAANNDAASPTDYVQMFGRRVDTDDGDFILQVLQSGAMGTVLRIDEAGRMGINTGLASLTESLETSGAIIIGDAAGTTNGTIRYTGTDFEGRVSGAWESLTTGGGGGDVSQTSGFTGADGYIAFWTGAGEIAGDNDLFYDRVNNRLGIGSSTPDSTLQIVNGAPGIYTLSIESVSNDVNAVFRIKDNSPGQTLNIGINFVNSANSAIGQISYLMSSDTLQFRADSTDIMWATGTGVGIGIGASSPARVLEVRDDTSNAGRLRITSTATVGGSYSGLEFFGKDGSASTFGGGLFREQSTDDITLWTSGGAVLTGQNSTGYVGIGTTVNEKLTVDGVVSLQETTSPSDTAGYGKVFVKSSDSKLYFRDDGGTEYDLTAAGGGGGDVSQTSGFTGADGYIAFFTGDGEIAGDNDLFFNRETHSLYLTGQGDSSHGRVGIGTTTPRVRGLEIARENGEETGNAQLAITSYSTNGVRSTFDLASARGTLLSPSAIQSGDLLGTLGFAGYATSFQTAISIDGVATELWSGSGEGSRLQFQTTANGETARSVKMVIDGSGDVGIGTESPHEKLTINGILSLEEQDDYDRTHDGYGSIWAKSDGKVYFTNDAGTEYDLTSGGGGGAPQYTITTVKTGAYSASFDEVVRADPSGGGFTITLPTASGSTGSTIIIKNVTSSTNIITIDTTGSDTIDGFASVQIEEGYTAWTFVSYGGTEWGRI